MDYMKLGNTGLDVSRICLGCMSFGEGEGWVHNTWALNEEDSRAIVRRALDLGVNFLILPMYTPKAQVKKSWGGH